MDVLKALSTLRQHLKPSEPVKKPDELEGNHNHHEHQQHHNNHHAHHHHHHHAHQKHETSSSDATRSKTDIDGSQLTLLLDPTHIANLVHVASAVLVNREDLPVTTKRKRWDEGPTSSAIAGDEDRERPVLGGDTGMDSSSLSWLGSGVSLVAETEKSMREAREREMALNATNGNRPVIGSAISKGFGFSMLKKLGWKEGTGLGSNGEGIVNPVFCDFSVDRRGLSAENEHAEEKTEKKELRAVTLTGIPRSKMSREQLAEFKRQQILIKQLEDQQQAQTVEKVHPYQQYKEQQQLQQSHQQIHPSYRVQQYQYIDQYQYTDQQQQQFQYSTLDPEQQQIYCEHYNQYFQYYSAQLQLQQQEGFSKFEGAEAGLEKQASSFSSVPKPDLVIPNVQEYSSSSHNNWDYADTSKSKKWRRSEPPSAPPVNNRKWTRN